MSESLVFRFPMPDRVLYANGRGHWAVKHKAKNALWAMCDLLVQGKVNPSPPKTPWEKAEIEASLVVPAVMDEGNCLNRLKALEDWLTTRGYVVDDSPKHLRWIALPTQRVSRKNTPEVVITLHPVTSFRKK